MKLHLGQLLGLPPGVIEIPDDLAPFRYALVLMVVLWAFLLARARPLVAVLAGCAFVAVAAGFWVLALARPYGLLEDADATRRAAEAGVRAAAGRQEGFLSGLPPSDDPWVRLADAGVPASVLLLLPSLLPPVVVVGIGLLVYALWASRPRAALAAILWLAFSTGDLDALRGVGVLPGAWSRPAASLALLPAVGAVLALFRVARADRAWPLVAAVVALVWWPATRGPGGLGVADAVLALTLDQGLWLPLGWYGLARRGEPSARALALAGALVVLAGALPGRLAADAWAGHALYRLGLILAATAPVADICEAIGRRLSASVPPISPDPVRVGAAAVLAVLLPGSFLTWWDPVRLDPAVAASLVPIRPSIVEAAEWIRRNTPSSAVILASPRHAPAVAALAGRRILRAPTVVDVPDDADRRRVEERILFGRASSRMVARYGVSHVVLAPHDFGQYWLGVEPLETRGAFKLVYRGRDFVSVYEVPRR